MDEIIRNVRMLTSLTPDQIRRLSAAASRTTLAAGQVLFPKVIPRAGSSSSSGVGCS